jgi:L-asparaginase
MRIKVFFTGGTIGSVKKDGTIRTDTDTAARLIELYREESGDNETEFDSALLFSMHSENLEFSDIEIIYDNIKDLTKDDCDGVIITHGTDTVAYTALFLHYLLDTYTIPVFLVTSNLPLGEVYSTGVKNFAAAVKSCKLPLRAYFNEKNQPEKNGTVSVPLYSDVYENHYFFSGTSLTEILPFSHKMPWLMNDNDFQNKLIKVPRFPERKNIVRLKCYPGLDYSIFDFKQKPDAILIELYHSGTAKYVSIDGTENVCGFAKRMAAEGVRVYAAPLDSRLERYGSFTPMLAAGIDFLRDITIEAAYVKLQIAYGSFDNFNARYLYLHGESSYFEPKD